MLDTLLTEFSRPVSIAFALLLLATRLAAWEPEIVEAPRTEPRPVILVEAREPSQAMRFLMRAEEQIARER